MAMASDSPGFFSRMASSISKGKTIFSFLGGVVGVGIALYFGAGLGLALTGMAIGGMVGIGVGAIFGLFSKKEKKFTETAIPRGSLSKAVEGREIAFAHSIEPEKNVSRLVSSDIPGHRIAAPKTGISPKPLLKPATANFADRLTAVPSPGPAHR